MVNFFISQKSDDFGALFSQKPLVYMSHTGHFLWGKTCWCSQLVRFLCLVLAVMKFCRFIGTFCKFRISHFLAVKSFESSDLVFVCVLEGWNL